jgi:hypothetical protein
MEKELKSIIALSEEIVKITVVGSEKSGCTSPSIIVVSASVGPAKDKRMGSEKVNEVSKEKHTSKRRDVLDNIDLLKVIIIIKFMHQL